MSRPLKIGLNYFPFDTDTFEKRKIQRLIRKCGSEGLAIYMVILCDIYKGMGYYINYSSELCLDIAFILNIPEEKAGKIQEVIEFCCELHLFNKDLMERKQVLTSEGIQSRYKVICKRSKALIREDLLLYDLPDATQTEVFVAKTQVSAPIIPLKRKGKEKENKKEERKENHLIEDGVENPFSFAEEIMNYFNTSFSGKLPMIAKLTPQRESVILARASIYGKESVKKMLDNVLSSPFLTGETHHQWRADFDWLFKPDNFIKVLEGVYNKKEENGTKADACDRGMARKGEILRMAARAAAGDGS
ncbi:DUF4373 domain-containing protein [Parabacteroides pacaensis]|uniref:DUF4373 domain-containing protein n=1 Tax=Parabacteroides pacaensis TaxID=2086575 RepID=UPI000D0F6827|nr:DUF4373 domain-containing protein [Parabacteroides pacaensis]